MGRPQPVGAFPGAVTEGALAGVAVLSPCWRLRRQEGAVSVTTITAGQVQTALVLPPHRAAGPALQTHRVAAVNPVSEAGILLDVPGEKVTAKFMYHIQPESLHQTKIHPGACELATSMPIMASTTSYVYSPVAL